LNDVNRLVCRAAQAVFVSVVAVSCGRAEVEYPTCDVNETRISDSTLGPLHIDEALPALRVRCPAVGDTVAPDPTTPGSVGALRLAVRGAPVIIRHDGKKVIALHTQSPFFRTTDSLGPGTSLAPFRNRPGIRVRVAAGQAHGVLLDRRRCGVAYELSGWGGAPPLPDDPPVRGAALASWPDTIVVRGVTVSGCRGNTSDLAVDSLSEAFEDSVLAASDTVPASPVPPALISPLPDVPSEPLAQPMTADSGLIATPAELAALAARLDVPVQGITRPQLRDTYAEERGGRVHEALDIPAPRGTPVISAADGRVLKLFDSKTGGLMVYAADPSDRFLLLYGHLDRYADGLKDGARLERGQVIGYVGTTGNAPIGTPHLHFAILRGRPAVSWSRGTAVNPYPLLVPPRR
jgi:hypothetical protein